MIGFKEFLNLLENTVQGSSVNVQTTSSHVTYTGSCTGSIEDIDAIKEYTTAEIRRNNWNIRVRLSPTSIDFVYRIKVATMSEVAFVLQKSTHDDATHDDAADAALYFTYTPILNKQTNKEENMNTEIKCSIGDYHFHNPNTDIEKAEKALLAFAEALKALKDKKDEIEVALGQLPDLLENKYTRNIKAIEDAMAWIVEITESEDA